MANAGYDVWIGNARGSQFSNEHTFLDPNNSPEYWNFSFHEIGKYDLPANIDFALKTINQTKIHYVGHSQGCTVFFVMVTDRPEYNTKIASMTAMAPAIFLDNIQLFRSLIINSINFIEVSNLLFIIVRFIYIK